MSEQKALKSVHLLKNGYPAHVFTTEDRRKGARRTNEIRRMRREAFEDEKFERAIAEMLARDEARKARKREQQRIRDRRRRTTQAHAYEPDLSGYEPESDVERIERWLERGYGARRRSPDEPGPRL